MQRRDEFHGGRPCNRKGKSLFWGLGWGGVCTLEWGWLKKRGKDLPDIPRSDQIIKQEEKRSIANKEK